MQLNDKKLGTVTCTVEVNRSAVDSFITMAWSDDLDRELTDEEIDYLNDSYVEEVQYFAYCNGSVDSD